MAALTLPDLIQSSDFAIETARGRTSAAELVVTARRHAAFFDRQAACPGVLIGIDDAAEALAVAVGAWWSGRRVMFARPDSPYGFDRQAAVVGATLVVTAADRAGRWDEPVSWAPRCVVTDDALDVLTSGTTGAPRAVVSTHAAIVANATALADAMGLVPTDRLWTSLYHGLPGALCTVTLAAAASGAVGVLDPLGDSVAAVGRLGPVAPTVVYAVPEFYEALARHRSPIAISPRWWLSSSAALARSTFDRIHQRWGVLVRSFYCGSEVGTVTFNDSPDVDAVRDGVGRPLPGGRMQLDEEGRIIVDGALRGRGYRVDGVTHDFPAAGVRTGDLGRIGPDGVLYLNGRESDRIHVGAAVVDPQVVEAHIASLTEVQDCLVVARPHPRLGHVLEARVVRVAGAELTERDVIVACRDRGTRAARLGAATTGAIWRTSASRTGWPARA